MEFLLFLNSNEKEILNLINKANYTVEENTPLCLIGKKFFGFLKNEQKKVVICTKNAKEYGGYHLFRTNPEDNFKTGLMIRRALRHEAVHIAQQCNNGNLLGLQKNKSLKLSEQKLEAFQGSYRLTGQKEKEYEAYLIEDQPKKIISELKKYCF